MKWLALLSIFLLSKTYAQVFTEDIEKINLFMAQEKIQNYLEGKGTEGLPGEYLDSLIERDSIDPFTGCVENPKPLDLRYKVVLITEDIPEGTKTKSPPQRKVFVAKFTPDVPLKETVGNKVKDLLNKQAANPGELSLGKNLEKGRQVIKYVAQGTSIDINTQVSGANAFNIGYAKDKTTSALVQVDWTNTVNVKQDIVSGTAVTGTLKTYTTTGSRNLTSLDGTTLEISNVNAAMKVESQITPKVSSYTGVTYDKTLTQEQINSIAGINIRIPNAQIIVFSSYNKTRTLVDQTRSSNREFHVELQSKSGVTIYGKVQDSSLPQHKVYEAGIKVDLEK